MAEKMQEKYTDVLIVGGGLAGLSLAKQLVDADQNISITIVERNRFPIANTTAKVGESTVELASHYLRLTLGLTEHFQAHHLNKNGLRCFFGKPEPDYAQQDELGTSALFDLPTFQLERGTLENHLFSLLTEKSTEKITEKSIENNVEILHGTQVESFQLGQQAHTSQIQISDHEVLSIHSRWFIDAAGRQSLLKDHLGLHQPVDHTGHAVWFRVNRPIYLDEWSMDEAWRQRLHCPGKRWLSTNHLMGSGYWVWVIPLASGVTSIGIVMDDVVLDNSNINTYEDALSWLKTEQPECAKALIGAEVLDFVKINDYAYGAKQVFSSEGWAMIGEAGLFADPFYSPGSDFIAIGNTLVGDLIIRSLQDEDIRLRSLVFERTYQEIFNSTLSLYQGQYGGFGDRQMMSVKLVWDYAYYWGVLALLFFRNALVNFDMMRELASGLEQARALNTTMQAAFVERAKKRAVQSTQGLFMNQYEIPCLHQVTQTLKKPASSCTKSDLKENVTLLTHLSPILLDLLYPAGSGEISQMEQALIGNYRESVQSSLQPLK